jgi:hypothetical protein
MEKDIIYTIKLKSNENGTTSLNVSFLFDKQTNIDVERIGTIPVSLMSGPEEKILEYMRNIGIEIVLEMTAVTTLA